MRSCVVCEGPLTGRQRLVCSPTCRNRRVMASTAWREAKARSEAKPETQAHKRKAWEAGKEVRECAWCGKRWLTHPRHRSRYCSHRCAKTPQGGYPSCTIPPGHPALPPPPLALPRGASPFREKREAAPSRRGVRFVSTHCRHCSKSYLVVGEYESSYCSRRCYRSYHKAQRRAQQLNARHEVVNRVAVFKRDAWRCHLCGFDVLKRAADGYHPANPTVDHVVPLSLGGDHTMANLRTAHAICNSIKGNRPVARGSLGPELAQGGGYGVGITDQDR